MSFTQHVLTKLNNKKKAMFKTTVECNYSLFNNNMLLLEIYLYHISTITYTSVQYTSVYNHILSVTGHPV